MMTNKLAIYIHIPFCESKCAYCNFVSGNYNEEIKKQYFQTLTQEINQFETSKTITALAE